MAGLDPWHIGELDVPFAGTPEHPVFVWSSNPFRIVGCTGEGVGSIAAVSARRRLRDARFSLSIQPAL